MLVSVGERISCALVRDGDHDLGHGGDLAHRLAGRDRHRHRPHARRRSSRCGRTGSTTRSTRQDRARRRLPGRLGRVARRDDARPRRLRHDRRRARGRARRGRLRDLHRRRGRLHRRPARSCPARASSTRSRYEEMLEMAASGAGVMATRSVEVARSHNVRLHVRSTFADAAGTWIREEEERDAREGDHLAASCTSAQRDRLPRARASPRRSCSARSPSASVNVDTIVQTGPTRSSSRAPVEDRADAARRARRRSASSGRRATTSARSASSAPA